jgi:hypothetical protein
LQRTAQLLDCRLKSDGVCMHLMGRRDLTGFSWDSSMSRKVRDRLRHMTARLRRAPERQFRVGSLTVADARHAERLLIERGPS